jgi:hypothetical protein
LIAIGRLFNNSGSEAGNPVNGLSGEGKVTGVISAFWTRVGSMDVIGGGVIVGKDKGVGAAPA